MKNLIIEATSDTPAVKFETSGKLWIEGRSLPESVAVFYDPLIEWVSQLDAEKVSLDINLHYLNSSSSNQLLAVLRILDGNPSIRELNVNWYYEVDDEDILESGQIYEELMNKASFLYHEFRIAA